MNRDRIHYKLRLMLTQFTKEDKQRNHEFCLNNQELEMFNKKNYNTKQKTIADLRKWYNWCEVS